MKAVIASLKFNPGHFSHLVANYKLFNECGFSSCLFVNKAFNSMDERGEYDKMNAASELKRLGMVDVAVFWFPSVRNILEILRLRLRHHARIIYVYHEPFDSVASYYRSGFRFKKILKICLIHLVNIPVLLMSHGIILPSATAHALYRGKYAYLNGNYAQIPLIFDDEADSAALAVPKQFISYIGTVAADHAFDRFVDFVDAAVRQDWFPELRFLIATSSGIPPREQRILAPHVQAGRVIIAAGWPMTNAEINRHFLASIVVWNAYNRSMQSGVLPKAYMFGAAVIGLARNANEFIDSRRTGICINNNGDVSEIRAAVAEIVRDQVAYAARCRRKFIDCFYYGNRIDDFRALLGQNLGRS